MRHQKLMVYGVTFYQSSPRQDKCRRRPGGEHRRDPAMLETFYRTIPVMSENNLGVRRERPARIGLKRSSSALKMIAGSIRSLPVK
jgi:hypothetical protein